jgi:hypothetical protein
VYLLCFILELYDDWYLSKEKVRAIRKLRLLCLCEGYCIFDSPTNTKVPCVHRSIAQSSFVFLWPLARLWQLWTQSSFGSFHMLPCRITFCAVNDCYNQCKYVDNVMQKEVWVVGLFIVRSNIEILRFVIMSRFCMQQWHTKMGDKIRADNLILLGVQGHRRLLHF